MKRDLFRFGIIGKSQAMRDLSYWVHTAAPHWDTILITGERGTGKELLAKAIHKLGPTQAAEPVTIDCAALHYPTVEAALFGHERGAFTGAFNRKIGYLETAQDNTIFLDEIGALPLETQGRFLRFLEERTITRIGSSTPIHIRTRIIAATNRDVASDAAHGTFLPDLFDRLSVLRVQIPALRDRENDIPLLMEHFLGKVNSKRISPDARQPLLNHPFPGNVRDLKNLCRRLLVFHPKGIIEPDHIQHLLNQ